VYGELWWLKYTIAWLRFRYKGEEENNEYETKLLQSLIHLNLKLLQNDGILEMWGSEFYRIAKVKKNNLQLDWILHQEG